MLESRISIGMGRVVSRRRIAKATVLALGIGAFGAAGLTGALAQNDSIFGEDWPFPSGGSGIFGEDWPFPSGSGGNINVGGTSGGRITMGGGGDISIGGGSSSSGSGGGSGNSGSSGGGNNYP